MIHTDNNKATQTWKLADDVRSFNFKNMSKYFRISCKR